MLQDSVTVEEDVVLPTGVQVPGGTEKSNLEIWSKYKEEFEEALQQYREHEFGRVDLVQDMSAALGVATQVVT